MRCVAPKIAPKCSLIGRSFFLPCKFATIINKSIFPLYMCGAKHDIWSLNLSFKNYLSQIVALEHNIQDIISHLT